MNGGAKLAKLGANLIIEKRWAKRGEKGKRKGYKIKRRDRERKSERGRGRSRSRKRNSSIYMTAVCLGRLLMGWKRVVVIKETRDSIRSGIHSAPFG